jgi:hypothetical protein
MQALVLFMGLGLAANGQSLADSIRTSFTKKPKLIFRWDSHGSFITNTPARMTVLGAGLRFGNYARVGMAIEWLNSNIYRNKIVPSDSTGVDTVAAKLNYGLVSFYSNIVVARIKKWEFAVPFELGFGASSYTYNNKAGTLKEFAKGGIITVEPMFMAEYKIFRWLGVGAGLGLRLVPVGNRQMKENFNSLLWDANMSVYFGEIYRLVKGSIKKRQERKQP